MGAIKDTFYYSLQEDYREFGPASVIFRFQQSNQQQQARRSASHTGKTPETDPLEQLHDHLRFLMNGEETPEAYIALFLRTLNADKKLLKGIYGETGRLLKELLDEVADPEKPNLSRREKLEDVVSRLDSEDPEILGKIAECSQTLPPYRKLQKLTEELINVPTHIKVKDFFSNAGYPLREDGRKGQTSRKPKIDKTLSLLEAFCEQNAYGLFQAKAYSDEECTTLFNILAKSGNEKVLIPLEVDPRTGCALYIVGKDYYRPLYAAYPENSVKVKKFNSNKESCSYGIFRFSSEPDHMRANASVGNLLLDGFDEFRDIRIAHDQYREACLDAMIELRECNGVLPPECSPAFAAYGIEVLDEPTAFELNAELEQDKKEFDEYLKNLEKN